MTIDTSTGLINWTPTNSQVGDNNVVVRVDDGNGGSNIQSFTIVVSAGIKGDVNNDGIVASNDAILALRIVTGIVMPTEYQEWAADVNNDGKIGSDDVILILHRVAGLAAPYKDVLAKNVEHTMITLTDVYGITGEIVTIPVKVSNYNILAGGDISITYDPRVLSAIDVSNKSVLFTSNINKPGIIRIAFAGDNGLNNEIIATLRFEILADTISSLGLQMVKLYQLDAQPIDVKALDGKFISLAMPPGNSELLQNFPNPFNPNTWIPYQLKEASEVKIRIYTASGELVRECVLGYKPAGSYISRNRAAYWDGKNEAGELVSSGIYFYTIQAGDFTATKKMIMQK